MTPTRAQYLIDHVNANGGPFMAEIPRAYRERYGNPDTRLVSNGMSEAENAYVKRVWATMPGNSNFWGALHAIAEGDAL